MDLKEKTLGLVTEDRIRTAYPVKRLNYIGLVYYAVSEVHWHMLEQKFNSAIDKIAIRAPSRC